MLRKFWRNLQEREFAKCCRKSAISIKFYEFYVRATTGSSQRFFNFLGFAWQRLCVRVCRYFCRTSTLPNLENKFFRATRFVDSAKPVTSIDLRRSARTAALAAKGLRPRPLTSKNHHVDDFFTGASQTFQILLQTQQNSKRFLQKFKFMEIYSEK